MTELQEQEPAVHPAALLLPWYLNGQLSPTERAEVEEHLRACTECSSELDSLTALRTQTREMFAAAPAPSARLRESVLAKVRQQASRPTMAGPTMADRIAQFFGELLQPRWAPTAAMAVIVAQLGVVGWLATRPHEGPPAIIGRGIPIENLRLQIVFNRAASLGDVQTALHDLGGHIVDGPSDAGAYVIELSPGPPQEIAAKLRTLRERPGLVERIENAAP